MGRQKGQGMVEYALILAFVVGIGGMLFANGNLADSIRSVFSNVNTLIEEASKPPLRRPLQQRTSSTDLERDDIRI